MGDLWEVSRKCECVRETQSDLIFVRTLWLQMENGLGRDEARTETGLLEEMSGVQR